MICSGALPAGVPGTLAVMVEPSGTRTGLPSAPRIGWPSGPVIVPSLFTVDSCGTVIGWPVVSVRPGRSGR